LHDYGCGGGGTIGPAGGVAAVSGALRGASDGDGTMMPAGVDG